MTLARSILKSSTLFLFTVLISAGVCELVVRMFVPVRNVGPSFTEYNPIYGKWLKKNFAAKRITPEFTMRLTTNSEGFRGPELGSLSRRPILFLGDSFTMGYGVNDGQEFPAVIRKSFNAHRHELVPVINAGMGDNGNGRWVIFLRSEAERYNPALVVLQICENDVADNIREHIFELAPDGGLRERPIPPAGARRLAQEILERIPGLANSYLVGLVRQISWDRPTALQQSEFESSSADDRQASRAEKLQLRLLEEALAICKVHGWPVLVVLGGIPNAQRGELEKFFSQRNVPTVLIPDKVQRPELYYKIDGHWNAAGQRFTAARVLEAIQNLHIFN